MMLMTMLFSLITFVQDISNNKELWKIAVKVHHKWNVITSTKHHFEMIMIDKEGVDIHVGVPPLRKGSKALLKKLKRVMVHGATIYSVVQLEGLK
ncbi:uncharacterized protein LOC131615997 isoform X3 [Vicia villosa]|uniref:uncharacterized protein LOC131615997 isoform X3 n=1 Tax=Vicia villosa TaxID=3911 RepID=UPI00273AC770|nr:uncharacterized protein LOC131615997 isoform X3 [Vicia villosa]